MASGIRISVLIDPELAILLEKFGEDRQISRNGAVRFLLRAALKIPRSDRDAVWREVRMEQSGKLREIVERALAELPASVK